MSHLFRILIILRIFYLLAESASVPGTESTSKIDDMSHNQTHATTNPDSETVKSTLESGKRVKREDDDDEHTPDELPDVITDGMEPTVSYWQLKLASQHLNYIQILNLLSQTKPSTAAQTTPKTTPKGNPAVTTTKATATTKVQHTEPEPCGFGLLHT